jgi:hypothetical protein
VTAPRHAAVALAALTTLAAPARAGTPAAPAAAAPAPAPIELHGYVAPAFRAIRQPGGRPQDLWVHDWAISRAAIILSGRPAVGWDYRLNLTVAPVAPEVDELALEAEEAWIAWQPHPVVRARAGAQRVPFTLQQGSATVALLFAERSLASDLFVAGGDRGLLVELFGGDKVRGSLGLWDGVSAPSPFGPSRGPLASARVDVSPLGPISSEETDLDGPPRVGFGAGALFRSATAFDEAGFVGARTKDLRLTGGAVATGRGLRVQGELLYGRATDDLTARPRTTAGAYAQLAYLVPRPRAPAIAPMVRYAWISDGRDVAPRVTHVLEAGATVFAVPGRLRALLTYVQERRRFEHAVAHGAVGKLVLAF